MPESIVIICNCKLIELCEICLIWLMRVKYQTDIVKNIIKLKTKYILKVIDQLISNDNLDNDLCFFTLKLILINILAKNKFLVKYQQIDLSTETETMLNCPTNLTNIRNYLEFLQLILKYCNPIIFDQVLHDIYTIIDRIDQIHYILSTEGLKLKF